jgi:hypothetical protein
MRKYASSSSLRNLSICVIILLLSSVLAVAQHGKLIHAFGVVPGDGSGPRGGLVADPAGNLYGATEQGGGLNACCGTVFELSPPVPPNTSWTETILYTFADGADGGFPYGNLVLDSQGNLFGTTNAGGSPNCFTGCGTVYELSPPAVEGGSWTETTIYTFVGGSDGGNPFAGLAFDQAGNLYGTTAMGGSAGSCGGPGCGTVFELSPPSSPGAPWTEAVLYSFTGGSDGGIPVAPLVVDGVGSLFGTTSEGGLANSCETLGCGTVFELTPSGDGVWAESVVHAFGSVNGDGLVPQSGLLSNKSGALAGTTEGGGTYGFGTVFGMQPPSIPGGTWGYSVLYSFGGTANDGLVPTGGVISDGTNVLFGTTVGGGLGAAGAVFQLTRSGSTWKETGLFSYANYKIGGAHPFGGLLLQSGALYGATSSGGSGNGGTVFKITR